MAGLPGGCNPADVLYKLAHGRGIKAPEFVQLSEEGPPHAKTFTWHCSFLEGQYSSTGRGRSKKEARNDSAKNLITQLDLSTLPQKHQKQHQGGAKAGAKRKAASDENYEDYSGQVKQGGKKKNRFGGGPQPLFGDSPGFGRGFQSMGNQDFGHFQAMGGAGFGNNFQSGYGYSDSMGVPGGWQSMGMQGEMGCMNPMGGMGPWDPPMMGMGGYYGGGNNFYKPKPSVADKQVMSRHQEIYPGDEELETILTLVDNIEKVLKKISDKFIVKTGENDREIKGVARVGDLAKGLLLTGDKEVNLVVMCNNKPTTTLLEDITTAMKEELESSTTKYEVHMFPEEGGLCVTSSEQGENEVPFQVTVTLTSTILRNQAIADQDKTKEEKEEVKSEDSPAVSSLLPREKGIHALAELRHSKWFSAVAANLPSCVETIRMMRDKVQRDISWSGLTGWATELLVERALASADRNLSPSSALMRVMEVVASGLLMPDGQGIQDPCEREEINVFNSLSLQTREDITKQAQIDLRNIHFRNIHLVIGSKEWDSHKPSGKEKQETPSLSSTDQGDVKKEEVKSEDVKSEDVKIESVTKNEEVKE